MIGPILRNFTLNYVFRGFFKDKMVFPPCSKVRGARGKFKLTKVNRFIISCADSLIIKVISFEEALYAREKLEKLLKIVGPVLNGTKTFTYDLLGKTRFEWLGYTFLMVSRDRLRYSKLVNMATGFIHGQNRDNQSVLINYISDANFKDYKKLLKTEIRKVKNLPPFVVLQRVNTVLRTIAWRCSFGVNRVRLDYLKNFVDRIF
jgi:hypothetical protein